MQYGKYMAIGTVLFMCLPMAGLSAEAHRPGFVLLDYEEGSLNVLIVHVTFAPRLHYIYRVEIEKNGELYEVFDYESQPRLFFFIYRYNVSANPGDEITVTAFCSLFGSHTETVTIPDSVEQDMRNRHFGTLKLIC
jgi:hypothetical protein